MMTEHRVSASVFSTIDIDIPWDYVWHIRSPGPSGAQCQGPAAGDIFTDVAISYS